MKLYSVSRRVTDGNVLCWYCAAGDDEVEIVLMPERPRCWACGNWCTSGGDEDEDSGMEDGRCSS